MKASRYLVVSAALLLAALHSLAMAQDEPPFRRGAALERMEQFKKIRMMEVLKLDEQTSIRFFSRYNKYQETLRELRLKQAGLLGQLQTLRRSNAGEGEYDKIIRELRALEGEMDNAKGKYLDELSEVLTKRQLAEYIVFEWRFQQNLRELLRDAQQGRGMPPR
ncbi:MAG: hypothetical protein FJ217_16515 [Ignavibacteria bacterium]|nr:hypothetical protein [Ignavibacteria bacterium]